VVDDLKRSLAALKRRSVRLRREAMSLVQADDTMLQRFELLTSMPGIAQISALQLLAELAPLSEEMSVRQWVAHSGLDPTHEVSGSSVRRPIPDQSRRQPSPPPGPLHACAGSSAARPAHEGLLQNTPIPP
jgi:transposase